MKTTYEDGLTFSYETTVDYNHCINTPVTVHVNLSDDGTEGEVERVSTEFEDDISGSLCASGKYKTLDDLVEDAVFLYKEKQTEELEREAADEKATHAQSLKDSYRKDPGYHGGLK